MFVIAKTDFGRPDCPGIGDVRRIGKGKAERLYVIESIYDHGDFPGIRPGFVAMVLKRKGA